MIEFTAYEALSEARAEWSARAEEAMHGEILGIAASMTATPAQPFIWWQSRKAGLDIGEVRLAPFNQIHQALLDPSEAFGSVPDSVAVLWRIEDLFPLLIARHCEGDVSALSELVASCRALAASAATMQERTGKQVLFGLPPPVCRPHLDLGSMLHGRRLMYAHREILHAIESELDRSRVSCFDVGTTIALHGIDGAHDWRKWYLYRQPYTETFWWRLSRDIVRVARSSRDSRKKCIVVDCDNTLWGGVIGEDGIGGIELGEDFPGNVYRDFQLQLKAMVASGVFLCIASKNNPDDVWRVFDNHDGMVLKREDVSVAEIGWGPKSEAIVRIATKLNIGLDSIVFVDDSMLEIATVEESLPAVTCVWVPDEELADLPFLLLADRPFDQQQLTTEDRERTRMFASEAQREQIRISSSPEEFRKSLKLELSFGRVKTAQVSRVAQLINKTNQFNLTTRRRSEAELAALVTDPDYAVYAIDVSDRFGQYGVVGVCVVRLQESSVATLDTFLLSCRALGRGVEHAFIAAIASDVERLGKSVLNASYLPTAKNAVCADFLTSAGFEQTENGTFSVSPSKVSTVDSSILLKLV